METSKKELSGKRINLIDKIQGYTFDQKHTLLCLVRCDYHDKVKEQFDITINRLRDILDTVEGEGL